MSLFPMVSILAVSDNLIDNVKYKVEDIHRNGEIEKINIFVEGVRVID